MVTELYNEKCEVCGGLLDFLHDEYGKIWVKKRYSLILVGIYTNDEAKKDDCPECQKKITEWLAKEDEFKEYYKKISLEKKRLKAQE